MQSESIAALAKALSAAQGEIKGALKDSLNPHFRSKYADLSSVWEVARPVLAKNGLSVIQTTRLDGERVVLVTTLAHQTGEWMRGEYPLEPVKRDPQGYGSAMTYARRYTLAAALGIAQVDDDANEASGKPANDPPPKQERPWRGPQKVTALKTALRELGKELHAATDQSELDGILENYKAAIEQCAVDLPDWYEETPDSPGLRKTIADLEARFAQGKAA